MNKIYPILLIIVLCFSKRVIGQINYAFSATNAPYAPVVGGTTPTLINRPFAYNQYAASYATGISNNIPVGFTFNYNQVNYTSINISANGFATLGSPFGEDAGAYSVQNFYINTLKFGPLLGNTFDTTPEPGTKPVLAPLWDDISASANADLRYITTGAVGSRVFIFEWANEKWQYDAGAATLSFELKIYEGTNVIEFCYKDEGGAPSSGASASIGITANSQIGGGFLSLQSTSTSPTVSTNVETTTVFKKPANNQVYRFTPLACAMPTNVRVTGYNNTSVNFAWDAPAGVSNFEYTVTTTPGEPAGGIPITGTAVSVSSLQPATKYYVFVRSVCGPSSKSASPSTSFIATKNISTPPPISWQKTYGGSEYESAFSVKLTPDGGYIMAGSTTSNNGDVSVNNGPGDAWIVKVNNIGAIEWQKNYGGSKDDVAGEITVLTDGSYIIAGVSNSNDGDVSGNHGDYDYWILKLSNTGNIIWQKSFGGSKADVATSIKETNDGGYIVAGISGSNNGDVLNNKGSDDCWIIKLNSSGTLLWQKTLGGSSYDWATSIENTLDGGYVFAGFTFSNDGDVSGRHAIFDDSWVVKLNSSGNIEWQKCLGGTDEDRGYIAKQTADGGYIVLSHSYSKDGDVTGNHGRADYWVVKLDATGSIQWQKSYGGTDLEYPNPPIGDHINQTKDGGYIITGQTSSNDGDVNGNHGLTDVWVLKIDGSGNFQWQKCLGGSLSEESIGIVPTPDGGYIVVGSTESNNGDVTSNHGATDIWLVKLGPDDLLPVTLLTLSGEARGKQNLLTWSTATEQNNSGFEIQRSADGYSFKKIGMVNTKALNGNSTSPLNYTFFDVDFGGATNYYRLKQIDLNGHTEVSNIVILNNKNTIIDGLVELYPNPAKNKLNIRVSTLADKTLSYMVTDIIGRVMLTKNTQLGTGNSIVQLDITTLPAGTYFVQFLGNNGSKTIVKKFIKE